MRYILDHGSVAQRQIFLVRVGKLVREYKSTDLLSNPICSRRHNEDASRAYTGHNNNDSFRSAPLLAISSRAGIMAAATDA
jgi:hypothetical protein